MTFKAFVTALFFTFVSASSLADDIHWHKPEFIERAFVEIALRNEYTRQGNFVRKWKKPIKIWLDHQVADQQMHTDLVRMHIEHLTQITGHPIQLVSSESQANLKIVFTRQVDWKRQVGRLFGKKAESVAHNAVCMANFRVNGRYEILSAGVIIPVDQARMHGKLVTCIVEEITQVLGLPNDSEKVYPSIFNDRTPEHLLSGLDYLLLKTLYQPEIKVGMTESQARPVLRKVIRKWQSQGTIRDAAREVRRGELYPLLGY
ncbi:DUF2927 domain-containing protein [Neptuniibacter sp.]|uniref:DUF2927 domain-containing protein n=1 Tax=Neptuniibacter sp. TaxID=1962643 RepID=UPI002619B4E2|nr:DUF2927 domain-containing protein [Neptuniibacter sp.]